MIERPVFSRLRGGLRIGPRFFGRAHALGSGPPPRGLVDRIEAYAHPGIDVARVDPSLLPFFLDPGSLVLRIRSRWRGLFALLWLLARPFAMLVGQLVLPLSRAEVRTEVLALDPAVDGRPDVRGVLRRHAGGAIMQVVAYATHVRGDAHFMHASFPIPLGHLAGVLRLDPIGETADGRLAVELTSRAKEDDAAIWIVHPLGSFRAPLGEQLRLWPAGSALAPADLDPEVTRGARFVGRHTQTCFGWVVVEHDYGFFDDATGQGIGSWAS